MSASWWISGQSIDSRRNLQLKEDDPSRDTDVGNGKQGPVILKFLDN